MKDHLLILLFSQFFIVHCWFHTDSGGLNTTVIAMSISLGLLVIIIIIIGCGWYKTRKSHQGKINSHYHIIVKHSMIIKHLHL